MKVPIKGPSASVSVGLCELSVAQGLSWTELEISDTCCVDCCPSRVDQLRSHTISSLPRTVVISGRGPGIGIVYVTGSKLRPSGDMV